MGADALRDELMAVPGVASAEVDVGESDAPAGVRVRLTPDADATQVGSDVQRVLAAHGMRSRFSDVSVPAEADDSDAASTATDQDTAPPRPEFPPPAVDSPPAEPPPAPEAEDDLDGVPAPPISLAADSEPTVRGAPQRVIPGGLRSVAMEERADGLGVIVTLDDGRTGSHDLTADDGAELDAAVIAAVAAAVDIEVDPVATEWMEVEGASIVTVVLRLADDALVAGAGVVRVGRAYAVGMAARAALDL